MKPHVRSRLIGQWNCHMHSAPWVLLFFATLSALCHPSSMAAQAYGFNNLSNNAQPTPGTDGTSVVTTDSAGDIIAIPFLGGTSTILVSLGASLPNGLGPATSFVAFGSPDLIGDVVYFGAQSASGSGYYSVPAVGGAIHVIVDSTSQDSAGRSVGALALPQDVGSTPNSYDLSPLPIPGIESNLFISSSGGATFAASLTSAGATQSDTAILNLSPSGVLSTVVDQANLSGCTELTNFATDGTIFAVWTVSSSGHVLLLENNSPSLSCSNVLLDLGVPGTNAVNILPGQPASGSILDSYVAPSTVIDSGYIYFSATMVLSDSTINDGSYSGIFRIRPGKNLEKVIATDNSALGTTGSVVGPPYNYPLYLWNSFAVRGDSIVLGSAWANHFGIGTYALDSSHSFFSTRQPAFSDRFTR